MIIECVDTDIGNKILKDLKKDGWRLVSQYDVSAFDKGIDFDSYTLLKSGSEIEMEWDNWMEWKITGSEAPLMEIAQQYSLKIKCAN